MYAQEHWNYKNVDSLSYRYYNSGEWDKLIRLGNGAFNKNIDFKYLRLRIGYAYYSVGKYYEAKVQFEKALSFDSFDSFGLEYLYYCYLNLGKEEYAANIVRRLNSVRATGWTPGFHPQFKPIESIDLEYNYKYSGSQSRSNPQYYRLGVSTRLDYGLTLYQSFSNYNQTIMLMSDNAVILDKQPEYYALLNWTASNHLLFKVAYHYINSASGTLVNNGNLFLLAVSPQLNRFTLEAYTSALYLQQESIYQGGAQFGYVFPGRLNFYLNGTLSGEFQSNNNRIIYNQKAGLKVSKNIWLEANSTFGKLTDYNDYDALYVYNSFDPITFRSGATLFIYMGKKITFWVNYSIEQKEYNENVNLHYNQFSYLGGLRWKL